jgi:hypothetical protein
MSNNKCGDIRSLLQSKIFAHRSTSKYNSYSQYVFDRLSKCHTSRIGYHVMQCDNNTCANQYLQYHCCGDRHCPNCGGIKREEWIEDRMSELLPTKYYHVVFTVPYELHPLFLINRKVMYDLIFESGHYTLTKLGRDPQWLGATPGIISILHTHGQDLSFHPHIHCIVSGGGVDKHGTWIKEKRKNGRFLYPRRVMEMMYKARFMKLLKKKLSKAELVLPDDYDTTLLDKIGFKKWNVYAKSPFGGPAQIIEYLGRYTHKVAITAHRILQITENEVVFTFKDYRDNGKQKIMRLCHEEFVRRFELHILPKKYVKIRHAGYMCHNGKCERIAKLSEQLNLPKPMPKVKTPLGIRMIIKTGQDITCCKKCMIGHYKVMDTYIMWNGTHVSVHDLKRKNKNMNIKNRGQP